MRRACIFLCVTHFKIIHSSFVPPSIFSKFWHDDKEILVLKIWAIQIWPAEQLVLVHVNKHVIKLPDAKCQKIEFVYN